MRMLTTLSIKISQKKTFIITQSASPNVQLSFVLAVDTQLSALKSYPVMCLNLSHAGWHPIISS
jgi:hypothetical protein